MLNILSVYQNYEKTNKLFSARDLIVAPISYIAKSQIYLNLFAVSLLSTESAMSEKENGN
jgi:hypothetical protein